MIASCSNSRGSHQWSIPNQPKCGWPCPLPPANPQGESSLPETLRVSTLPPQHLGDETTPRREDGEDFTSRAGGGGAPGGGSVQTRESLRWEAALEDPQAEDKRLELYRANRRQRYIARRERLWWKKERKCSQRSLKEEKKAAFTLRHSPLYWEQNCWVTSTLTQQAVRFVVVLNAIKVKIKWAKSQTRQICFLQAFPFFTLNRLVLILMGNLRFCQINH